MENTTGGFFAKSSWFFYVLVFEIFYIVAGVFLYFILLTNDSFSPEPELRTTKLVDGFYFVMITLCSIGYGDFAPASTLTRAVFGVYGFFGRVLTILFVALFEFHLVRQITYIPRSAPNRGFVRLRRFLGSRKISKALCVAAFSIMFGVFGVLATEYEELKKPYSEKGGFERFICVLVDIFYLMTSSVSTIGYGDVNFKTARGRAFAAIYMPAAAEAYAHCCLIVIQTCIERGPGWADADADGRINRALRMIAVATEAAASHGEGPSSRVQDIEWLKTRSAPPRKKGTPPTTKMPAAART